MVKLTYNDKVNIYKRIKSGKATYPNREKEPVHLFDLKGYVNKKKEEKMNNLVNSVMPGLGIRWQVDLQVNFLQIQVNLLKI